MKNGLVNTEYALGVNIRSEVAESGFSRVMFLASLLLLINNKNQCCILCLDLSLLCHCNDSQLQRQ